MLTITKADHGYDVRLTHLDFIDVTRNGAPVANAIWLFSYKLVEFLFETYIGWPDEVKKAKIMHSLREKLCPKLEQAMGDGLAVTIMTIDRKYHDFTHDTRDRLLEFFDTNPNIALIDVHKFVEDEMLRLTIVLDDWDRDPGGGVLIGKNGVFTLSAGGKNFKELVDTMNHSVAISLLKQFCK